MVEATLSSTFSSSQRQAIIMEQQQLLDAESKRKKRSSASSSRLETLFQDAITVTIPMNVTVDLGVAIRRTRTKRIDAIYKAFPSLQDHEKKNDNDDEEEDDEEEDDEEKNSDNNDEIAMDGDEISGDVAGKKLPKKKTGKDKKHESNSNNRSMDNVPQRHEFASIMDYLEAKYVRGVMLQEQESDSQEGEDGDKDESGKQHKDDDDEGDGSVYSESSFINDTDLQRNIAEQVLAQTTTTKVELEGDDDFFVNVGDLVVQESEHTQENYDPLDDNPKLSKPSKKRKKPCSAHATTTTTTKDSSKQAPSSPPKKKPLVAKKKKGEEKGHKKKDAEKSTSTKKAKEAVTASPKKTKAAAPKTPQPEKEDSNESDDASSDGGALEASAANKKVSKKSNDELKKLRATASQYRKIVEKRFAVLKKMIKEMTKEQLPRRPPLKSKVTITCPPTKKEGDEVTFANPHIPGQRLKVQVPKGTFAGETFKVTVPVPKMAPGDEDEGTDHNKFPRDLQDELDMYAREYDDYCKHEGELRHAKNEEYPIHLEKRKKYDQLVKEFPKNLMTKIDQEYMKKLVRRARQNKSKRSKTATLRRVSGDPAAASPTSNASVGKLEDVQSSAPQHHQSAVSDQEQLETADNSEDEDEAPPGPPAHRTLDVPERGSIFPSKVFRMKEFHSATAGL
jgi:hypothetical protein